MWESLPLTHQVTGKVYGFSNSTVSFPPLWAALALMKGLCTWEPGLDTSLPLSRLLIWEFILLLYKYLGFPSSPDGKESACNAGDPGLIPELGRPPGEGNGYLLQYSCLENSMDRGALYWAPIASFGPGAIKVRKTSRGFTCNSPEQRILSRT